ncbi:hypothetical protein ACVWWK_002534 [Bradyrhizobium sp. LB9.1b]
MVAKVDRLTRSVAFLSKLLEAGVDVRFADLPTIEGPTGRFMLQQMASVAELEAGLISSRTKAALAAAKQRGKRLGGHRGVSLSRQSQGRRTRRAGRQSEAAGDRPCSPVVSTQLGGHHVSHCRGASFDRARHPDSPWGHQVDGLAGASCHRTSGVEPPISSHGDRVILRARSVYLPSSQKMSQPRVPPASRLSLVVGWSCGV